MAMQHALCNISFLLNLMRQETQMGYVNKILGPDERVVNWGSIHKIIYLDPVITLTFSAIMLKISHSGAALNPIFAIIGILLLVIGGSGFISALIQCWTTEIAITNRRIIVKRGLIRRQTMEMNLNKVESVFVEQSVLGRVLNYGNVDVRGTGSSIEDIDLVAAPIALRKSIEITEKSAVA